MNNSDTRLPKKGFGGIHIGSASLLMVFVILCLISFAVLSFVSARADSRLTHRIMERTQAYYEACNSAESALAGVDNTLQSIYSASAGEEEYFQTVGHSKSYVIPISDLQTLQVTIEILYPTSDEDSFFRITNWQVITKDAEDN